MIITYLEQLKARAKALNLDLKKDVQPISGVDKTVFRRIEIGETRMAEVTARKLDKAIDWLVYQRAV